MIRNNLNSIASLLVLLAAGSAVSAAPIGYSSTSVSLPSFNAAVAYKPDGTRYVIEGTQNFGDSTTTLKSVLPSGAQGPSVSVSGTQFRSVAGAAWDQVTGRLLVADNFPGGGTLVSIDPVTGTSATIVSNLANIDDVAVRATGEIFVSNAAGSGAGAVYQVNRANGNLTAVMGNMEFAGGLAFDNTGNLIVQESYFIDVVNGITTGRVFRLPISGNGGSLDIGTPQKILDNMGTSFDVAVDSDNDIFVTGSGGLVRVDGTTLAMANFENNGSAFQFAGEIAFLALGGQFEPFAGVNGGRLTYIPDFNSSQLIQISPVPEPGSLVLFSIGVAACALVGRRRRLMRRD